MGCFKVIALDVKAEVSKGAREVTNTMTGFVLGRTTISKLMHLNDIVTNVFDQVVLNKLVHFVNTVLILDWII